MKRKAYPNGKELMIVNYGGDRCAVYREEYAYGDSLALFMYDMTTDEFWGDITINLPGYSHGTETVYLQDFIDSKVIKALSPLLEYQGSVRYNYGTYGYADVNQELLPKIPTWDELCEMLGFEQPAEEVDATTDIMADTSEEEYKGYYISYNLYGKGEYTVDIEGDDVWCNSPEEARKVIDAIVDPDTAITSTTSVTAYTNAYYKDEAGNGYEWLETPHKLFIDGEWGTYTDYSRDLGNGYLAYIIPEYFAKTDMLVYQVSVVSPDIEPVELESFETFYDAMDFVDSGELAHRMGW